VTQPIARRTRRIVFDIEHTRQGDAITRPAAAMREEILRLGGTTTMIRVSEMIAAADEAGGGGTTVMGRERRVDVSGSFCSLFESSGSVSYGEEKLDSERPRVRELTLMMTKRAPLL